MVIIYRLPTSPPSKAFPCPQKHHSRPSLVPNAFPRGSRVSLLRLPRRGGRSARRGRRVTRQQLHPARTACWATSCTYIDGGDFSQYVDGELDAVLPRMNNKTLSIDLRKAWTNDSVEINTIYKGDAPVWKYADLWTDSVNSAFYAWTGENARWRSALARAVEVHAGRRRRRHVGARDAHRCRVVQPAGAAGGGLLGGAERRGLLPWGVHGGDGRAVGGQLGLLARARHGVIQLHDGRVAQHVGERLHDARHPVLGPDGGGAVRAGGSWFAGHDGGRERERVGPLEHGGPAELRHITMYDPVEGAWYSQETTGDAPSVRDGFCLVGAQGSNGTYELFLYGGWIASLGDVYNDVYVLSLPGFHWFKGPSQGQPRMDHTCEVIGNGSRQMAVVGGLALQGEKWEEPDDLRNGLGVLDLKTLEWASSYDPDIDAYDTPDDIQAWYNKG